MSKAIDFFEQTHARAISQLDGSNAILRVLNDVERDAGRSALDYNDRHEVSDMVRFGIVLAVAAMDDYFTRKYAEVMVPCIKRHGVNSHFTVMLENAGLDLAGALELLAMERPYRRIRTMAQDFYRNYSTQSTDKIDKLYKTIGITGLSAHSQRRSTKKKSLLKSINEIVSRRHKIVHAGDLTRTGRLQKIDQRLVNRISDIKMFVESADQHIDAFMSQRRR